MPHVVIYDFGAKWSILRNLVDAGCRVTVVPARTAAADVLALAPDGVGLSNGPGDPEPLELAISNTRALLGRVPVLGICLGHQILGLACGGKTYKLKFGHHGGNHPVINLQTRRVEISAHNHNFAVDPESLPQATVELTHVNLNDNTLEGLRRKDVPAMSVQYHPEGAPGPHDAHYLFKRFVDVMQDFGPKR
jgi:carbamoyl-phosphate synthase small subunit